MTPIDLDHVAPGLAQPSGNSCSFGGVGDVAEPRHDEVGGDGEHHIRVVNRLPRLVDGVEHLGGVAHRFAPLIKDRLVGAARAGHVGDAVHMVEHEGARPLEIAPLEFNRAQVKHLRNAVALAQRLHHITPPFASAAGGGHRVEHHSAIVMGRDPVVRKDRVGGIDPVAVIEHDHADPLAAKGGGHGGYLDLRLGGD